MTQSNYEPEPPQYPTTQPYVSGAPQYQGPSKKKSKAPWIIGSLVAVVLCCGGGAVMVATSDSGKQGFNDGKKPASTGSPTSSNDKPAPPPKAAPQKHTPVPAEIKLTIKITKKQCFGSAGCLVDFRIGDLSYTGAPMDASKSYEVVYEVKGLKDPYTNTLTLSGDGQFEFQKEENGQTSTTSVKLSAKVTAVEEL